jgi:zinc finger protein 830
VKQWDAHLLTKQHRTSLAREKSSTSGSAKSKRPADSESGGESTKRARTETEEVVKSSILPAGFFSSGNGPKIVRGDDDDEEEEEEPSIPAAGPSKAKAKPAPAPAPSAPAPTKSTAAPAATQTGDEELDSFLASLAEPDPVETAPEPASAGPAPTAVTQKSTSRKPTTSSYRDIIPGQASYEAAPVRNIPKDQEVEPEPEVQESEAERRARVAREEKEEIMDRLEDEERAQ